MARRRSLNRRWSRRSGNTMDLNPDSELIDEENPAWWKNLEQTTILRPSAQTSYADVTQPILSASSLVNESDIEDRWWDNLDRTSLHSSRRFSTRQSLNPEATVQDSVASDGADDVSIKKRKIQLRARQKQSGGMETFLRAFDDSDVARSEPEPSKKRKTESPAKSDADILRRKIRGRHSRSLADVDRGETSANTSNDTDIVVKARPKAFKKRAAKLSTGVYDEILTEAGPSGINSSKNAAVVEAASTPVKTIDSNESGFMGPSITESHRKRLSTISKKLDMSSDDSEPGKKKARLGLRQKSGREDASFNPFDDILSGQLNASSGSAEAANKSGRSSNAATRISKSLRQSHTLPESTIAAAEDAAKDVSAGQSQLRETERTINEEAIGDEENSEIQERDRISPSGLEENLRVSRRLTENAGVKDTVTSEWDVPDTQEDPRTSTRRTKNSTIIVETMDFDELPESQDSNRRSSVELKENLRRSKSRTRNATIEESATSESDVPSTQQDPRKSTRRTKNSTIIRETMGFDELPESQEANSRSSVELKEKMRRPKSRTRNATIEENTISESDVPGTQQDPRKSTRRTKNSTIIGETMGFDELPESQEANNRSSVELKEKMRRPKSRTRNATIEESTISESDVPGTQQDSRISTRRTQNSTIIAESVDPNDQPETQKTNRRLTEGSKRNVRDSKSRTRNSSIEEAATSESDAPGSRETSRKSNRRSKTSTRNEESANVEELPGARDRSRRSSSVSKRNPRSSRRLTRHSTISEATVEDEDMSGFREKSFKSSSAANKNPRDSIREAIFKGQSSQSIEPSILAAKSRNQLFQDWGTSGSEEDDVLKSTKRSTNVSHDHSSTYKMLEISIPRLTSTKIHDSRQIEDLEEDSEKDEGEEKIYIRKSRSLRSPSRALADSAYELPDKERSASLIISMSEGESTNKNHLPETSTRKSPGKKRQSNRSTRESVNRSILDVRDNKSGKSAASFRTSRLRHDSGESDNDIDSQEALKVSRKSVKNHFAGNTSVSRKSVANAGVLQDQNSDQSISEELAIGSWDANLSRRSSRLEKKASDPKRTTGSRLSGHSDKSTHEEEKHHSPKSNLNLSRRSSRVDRRSNDSKRATGSRFSGRSDRSMSEEEKHHSPKSNLNLSRRSSRVDRRTNDSKRATGSRLSGRSDRSISEEEKHHSPKSNLNLSRRSSRLDRRTNDSKRATGSRRGGGSDRNISEEEEHRAEKTNLNLSRRSSRLEKRSATPASATYEDENLGERISDVDLEIAEASQARRISPPADNRANTSRRSSKHENISGRRVESDAGISEEESNSRNPIRTKGDAGRKSSVRPNISRQRIDSDESISEGEPYSMSMNHAPKDKSNVARKSAARPNISKQRIESDESIDEQESNSKSVNQAPKDKSVAGRKSSVRPNVSRRRIESDANDPNEDAENLENRNPLLDNSAKQSDEPPADISRPQNATNHNKSSFSTVENIHGESSTTIPSESIPLAPVLTKLPQDTSSFLGKSNATRAQKNITDFYPLKFLQRTDASKTLDSHTSFDKEKLERVQKLVERKRQEIAATRMQEAAKRKQIPVAKRTENFLKAKKSRTNENARQEAAKPPKAVDKAYIVNGQVYKRPKLPRPKPWVTDRLYRHLWKKMEPKFNLRTRVKSESFVEQLAGIVALTIRRKKYESYKAEVDALMEEMARLNIIKTRNDFYDFCYDYLPYDFRVKVTPMLLPGNVRNIPYDPAKLHTPILPASR